MIIMGVDPGLAVTGWAIVRLYENKIQWFSTGSIKTTPHSELVTRARRIAVELEGLFSKWKPVYLSMEDYTYQGERSNLAGANAMKLPFLVGTIYGIHLLAQDYPIKLIKKQDVNRALGMKGQVPKSRVKQVIETICGDGAGKNEHERDALAVALAGAPTARAYEMMT